MLTQGIDSLKVEHLGIRLLSVQWFAHTIALSYHMAGIGCVGLGFVFMFAGFKIFDGMHKRVVAANPRMAQTHFFIFFVPAAILGFLGWEIVNAWFTTHI
jgi:hypothetical protein